MKLGRLSVVLGSTALLFAGTYACSSDDDTTGGTADAGVDTGTANPADTGSTTPPNGDDDGSTGNTDSGADSGSVDLSGCVGNPLVADGGTPDASVASTAAATIGSGNFLYGPVWVDDLGGSVVYSETFAQRIDITDGGAPSPLANTVSADDLPNQNAASNGFIYTAISVQDDAGAIMKTQIDGGGAAGASTTFRIPVTDGGFIMPSGVAIHSKGILYMTDPQFQNSGDPTPGIYSMPVGGGAITTIATFTSAMDDRPVGIAFNKDQSALFVSHYSPGTASHISKYTVDGNGAVSNPVNLPIALAGHPTGIGIDTAGNIWVAEKDSSDDAVVGGRVEVFDSTGATRWGTILFPTNDPTGIAFGGADRKKAIITTEAGGTSGTLYALPTRCQGF